MSCSVRTHVDGRSGRSGARSTGLSDRPGASGDQPLEAERELLVGEVVAEHELGQLAVHRARLGVARGLHARARHRLHLGVERVERRLPRLGHGARDEHRVAHAVAEQPDHRRHRAAGERVTGEHDVVEAGRIDVGADRFGAVGERHRTQVGRMRAAPGEVDGDRRGGHEAHGWVPSSGRRGRRRGRGRQGAWPVAWTASSESATGQSNSCAWVMRDVVIVEAVRSPVGRRKGGLSAVHSADLLGDGAARRRRAVGHRPGRDRPGRRRLRRSGGHAGGQHHPHRVAAGRACRSRPRRPPSTRSAARRSRPPTSPPRWWRPAWSTSRSACGVEVMSGVPMGSTVPKDPFVGKPINRNYWEHYENTVQFEGAERIAEKLVAHPRRARRVRQAVAGPRRGGVGRGSLRHPDRADRGARRSTRTASRTAPRRHPRRGPARHDARGAGQPQAGARPRSRVPHRRHRVADQRRRRRGPADDGGEGRRSSGCSRGPASSTRASSGSDPVLMLTGPIPATEHLLDRNKLTIDDIDLVEINEAFASVVLGWQQRHRRRHGAGQPQRRRHRARSPARRHRHDPAHEGRARARAQSGSGARWSPCAAAAGSAPARSSNASDPSHEHLEVHRSPAYANFEMLAGSGRVVATWRRFRAMTTTPAPPAPPSPPVAARFIGKSVTRKEDQRLLTGHGLYVDDVKVAGTLHAAFLRSDLACAAITRIDTSAAKELAGRRRGVHVGGLQRDQRSRLPLDDERGAGGAAPARDHRRALRRATRSRWSSPRRATSPRTRASSSRSTTTRRPRSSTTRRPPPTPSTSCTRGWGLESNAMVQVPFTPLSPDLDDVFASAAHVIECDVEQNRYVAMPMETRGIVASFHKGREELDIACATQSVHETKNFFARYVQIPEGHVHVTARDVGGGFGQKMFVYREECAVVLASFLLGRPVKWIEDRRENLLSAGHSRNELAHVKVAVDDDGIIQAITADHVVRRRRVRGVPGGHGPDAAARPVQDAAPRLLDRDGVDQHHGQGRVPRAVDVRDDRARDGARPRRRRDRHGPGGAAPAQPARVRRPAVHRAERQRVPGDHPARDARSRRSSSSTTRRSARSRPRPRAAGPLPRRGHLLLRGADVDGEQHARHRSRNREGRDERPRRRVPRHHLARPEHRDHDGADRRRAPRRRVRRRHHRAGRLALDAVRAGHRREPHRGRRRRRGARGDGRRAREGDERRRAHDGGVTRRPRDRRGRGVGARDAVEVGDAAGRRQAGVPPRQRAARRASRVGSRRPSASGPRSSPRGRTPRTSASSRSTARRGCPR